MTRSSPDLASGQAKARTTPLVDLVLSLELISHRFTYLVSASAASRGEVVNEAEWWESVLPARAKTMRAIRAEVVLGQQILGHGHRRTGRGIGASNCLPRRPSRMWCPSGLQQTARPSRSRDSANLVSKDLVSAFDGDLCRLRQPFGLISRTPSTSPSSAVHLRDRSCRGLPPAGVAPIASSCCRSRPSGTMTWARRGTSADHQHLHGGPIDLTWGIDQRCQ